MNLVQRLFTKNKTIASTCLPTVASNYVCKTCNLYFPSPEAMQHMDAHQDHAIFSLDQDEEEAVKP